MSRPTPQAAAGAIRGPRNIVPNQLHFVWVGRRISQEDLQVAQHYAARGANVSLWTDNPQGAVATATSMHHPSAGSLDSSVPIRGVPSAAGGAQPSADSSTSIAARSVDQAFAHDCSENGRALNKSQLEDSVGLGNPGARSDAVRYQVLFKHGGVYMDFDRAQRLRLPATPEHNRLAAVKESLSAQHASGLNVDHTVRSVLNNDGFSAVPFSRIDAPIFAPQGVQYAWEDNPAVNIVNDLLAAAPEAQAMDRIRQHVREARASLAASKPFDLDNTQRMEALSQALEQLDRLAPQLTTIESDLASINQKVHDLPAMLDSVRRLPAGAISEGERSGMLSALEAWGVNLRKAASIRNGERSEREALWSDAVSTFRDKVSPELLERHDPPRPALKERNRADQARDPKTWQRLPVKALPQHHPDSAANLARALAADFTVNSTGPNAVLEMMLDLVNKQKVPLAQLSGRAGFMNRLNVDSVDLNDVQNASSWLPDPSDPLPAGFEAPAIGPSKRSALGHGFEVGGSPRPERPAGSPTSRQSAGDSGTPLHGAASADTASPSPADMQTREPGSYPQR